MRPRSRSGGRSPKRAMPTPQFNLGQAYRLGRGVPINLARGADLVRAGRAARAMSTRRPRSVCLLFQNGDQAGGLQVAEAGRRARRAARHAGLRDRAVQRRRRHAGPGARLCLCQPRRRPGAGSRRKETLDQLDQLHAARRAARRAWRWRIHGAKRNAVAAKSPSAKPARQAAQPASQARSPSASAEGEAAPLQAQLRRPATVRQVGGWRIQLGAFRPAQLGRGAVSAAVRQAALAGRQALLYPARERSPDCRSARSQARPPRQRPAARSAPPASRSRRK